VFRPAILLRSH